MHTATAGESNNVTSPFFYESGIMEGAEGWIFRCNPSTAKISPSGRKVIYKGTFADRGSNKSIPAIAAFFDAAQIDKFGLECAALSHLSHCGVGPKLLGISKAYITPFDQAAVIVEADAGTQLSQLLAGDGTILHPVGSAERAAENVKIMFDLIEQLANAHEQDIYHRDLSCGNVCIRRFGASPEDIKATIIDFESRSGFQGGKPTLRACQYQTLFEKIPTFLARQGDLHSSSAAFAYPNPLEVDLAYLSALHFHLIKGREVLNRSELGNSIDEFLDFLEDNSSYFRYGAAIQQGGREDTRVLLITRRLSKKTDSEPLARSLQMTKVETSESLTPLKLRCAHSLKRSYLDKEDLELVSSFSESKLEESFQEIVRIKFEAYKQRRRSQNKPVEYENIEDQPADLQKSNYAQAAHIPVKIAALGYLLIPMEECDPEDRVLSFTLEQTELLAEMEHERWMNERIEAGWTSGERNHEKKTTPYLVPYAQLDEDIKEYDRDAVRALIALVEQAGLAVSRQK